MFHIWPKRFPRGYLGVDVFFVLSGYLMAMILGRNKVMSLDVAVTFYKRRIRRIVPIYLTVVSTTLFSSMALLFRTDIPQLKKDALPAVTFTSNMMAVYERWDYFDQLEKTRMFLHTWSLSAEIQFYIFVPVLFAVILLIRPLLSIALCTCIAAASLYAQAVSRKEVAFGFLHCRLWQFMAGIIANIVAETLTNVERVDDHVKVEGRYIFSGSLIGRHFMPHIFLLYCLTSILMLNTFIANRIVVVALTAFLLVQGAFYQSKLLSNFVLVWIGDISYVVYLVHWPTIQLYKYWSVDTTIGGKEGCGLILISFLVAFSLDKHLDSRYRKLSTASSLAGSILTLYTIIAILYSLIPIFEDRVGRTAERDRDLKGLVETLMDKEHGRSFASMLNAETKIILNYYLTGESYSKFECKDKELTYTAMTQGRIGHLWECNYKGKGTKKVFVIGNSHARQLMDGIVRAFEDDAMEFHMFAISGCIPVPEWTTSAECHKYSDAALEAVKKYKPDILFVVFQYIDVEFPLARNISSDKYCVGLRKFIEQYKPLADVIYFNEPNLEFPFPAGPVIAKRIWQRLPVDNIRLSLEEHNRRNKNALQRVRSLACAQCRLIDYTKVFCAQGGGYCYPYDRATQISFFFDKHHVNWLGSIHVAPHLKELYWNGTRA